MILCESYVSENQTKAFCYQCVQGFDYYPQMVEGRYMFTLRVILGGGDQWYEGEEATKLHQILLGRAQSGLLGCDLS